MVSKDNVKQMIQNALQREMIQKCYLPNIGAVRTGKHTWRRMTMNATATSIDQQTHTSDYEEQQYSFSPTGSGESREMHTLWYPEELAEPDVWTLANFGDVLPYELA